MESRRCFSLMLEKSIDIEPLFWSDSKNALMLSLEMPAIRPPFKLSDSQNAEVAESARSSPGALERSGRRDCPDTEFSVDVGIWISDEKILLLRSSGASWFGGGRKIRSPRKRAVVDELPGLEADALALILGFRTGGFAPCVSAVPSVPGDDAPGDDAPCPVLNLPAALILPGAPAPAPAPALFAAPFAATSPK